ncbi:Leucine aminopeptidase [Dionaea muscipula]
MILVFFFSWVGLVLQISALDARYRLAESKDYEVKVAFLQLAISARCREFYGEVEKTLKEVVRMKYLRPLYTTLAQGGLGPGTGKEEEEKTLAKRVFTEVLEEDLTSFVFGPM